MNLLLYEPLPLRTLGQLGDYAEDPTLPLAHVFGDLTAARFPLRRISDTRGHAADHAMEITGAGSGTTPTGAWAAAIEDDGTGHVCTFVDYGAPVPAGDVMWAYGRGKRNPRTGALIENPAEIMESVSVIGWRSDKFQFAREQTVGLRLAGRFAEALSIRGSIDIPAQSAGLIWCAGMAKRYPGPVSGYVLDLDQESAELSGPVAATIDDTADILRIAYDLCDVTGKYQKAIELTASPQRYGGVLKELALPMLRTPADAVTVGTPILQRLACERYDVPLAISRTDVRPGQWLRLKTDNFKEWPFPDADPVLMVKQVDVDHANTSTQAQCEWLRTTPSVVVTAFSVALSDTFAGSLEVSERNGIATFTVYDPNHRGLQGARVALDGGEPRTTDDRGQVSFPYIAGHEYRIDIEAPGYDAQTLLLRL